MDAAAAAAPGAGGPLLLLPPPPAYTEPALDTAYVADASFSPRAMRPLYGATRLLTELLLPREALPPDVLQVTPSGALLVQGPPEEVGGRVLAHYASPVAVAAATLLFAALLPLAGLLFCCARCCCCRRRPPPPPASRRAKRRAACRRATLGLALAAAATAMLFGVVCAFVTNEYMQEGSDALPGRLRVATMDARLYLNNTRRHMSHLLVTNFHELRDNLEHSLNSTGQLMIAGLKNVSNATVLDKVANLTSMLDSAQQDLHMLHNLTHDAHEAARDLDKELRALRARVDALHKRCKDQHACRDALNASAAAADADFSQLAAAAEAAAAGEGGGAAQAALAAGHLQSSVRRAEDELRGLARRRHQMPFSTWQSVLEECRPTWLLLGRERRGCDVGGLRGRSLSMLGLGDVVMPGLLLCFVLRYDAYKKSQLLHLGETGVPPPKHLNKLSYFHCSLIGYFLGLLTATVSSEVFKAAQPALLYLVPFTLLPLLTMAYLKGDLRRMWSEPFIIHPPSKHLEV